ncbi:MAG: prepilin-type N-terminal cleavage/methylation domain-containing protein [Candidatus Riflebacteria bacterium]|nr:prepilin-type N-terminal cleavage/methylation domain-containing protein [Candidatus Riflebacteria bacterium]
MKTSGFTLIETMMTLLLMSLLFFSTYKIMTYARMEAEKASWMQARLIELRNATRLIGSLLKKSSYPSTVVKQSGMEMVISYKEWREFDGSGRLRKMEIRDSNDMDLAAVEGAVLAEQAPKRILLFPVCTPEKDLTTSIPGKISWYELHYEPEEQFTPGISLGYLRLIEREDSYDTKGNPKRAFGISPAYSPQLPIKTDRIIAKDVSLVEVASFSNDELRGIAVDSSGTVAKKTRRRTQLMVKIQCTHPKEALNRISDQSIVVTNLEMKQLAGGPSLKVISVGGTAPDYTVSLEYGGSSYNAKKDQVIQSAFKVTYISPKFVSVSYLPGGTIRTLPVPESP